jgi:hypothetical protein
MQWVSPLSPAERNKETGSGLSAMSGAEALIAQQLKAETEGVAPELPRHLLGSHSTLPPDPLSPYAQARAREQAQRPTQAQAPVSRPAQVIDPDRQYAARQPQTQQEAYVQRVQNAAQDISRRNYEIWLQEAAQLPPDAYLHRAAQLEAQANEESYDADNAKNLMREAQRMRWTAGQVAQRVQQIHTQVAFNEDAQRVIASNPDLKDVSKNRGRFVYELFEAFPQLATLPTGASVALKICNMAMKNRREGGR